MKFDEKDAAEIVSKLKDLAQKKKYTKIFAKVPVRLAGAFLLADYKQEAVIPRLHKQQEDVAFLGRFLHPQRQIAKNQTEIDKIIALAQSKGKSYTRSQLPTDCTIHKAGKENTTEISRIYKRVFETYPFPIHDPKFLARMMDSHVDYFCVKKNGLIVAVSSAEKDVEHCCCEMTDFATLPEHRGNGYALHLLNHMNQEMVKIGITTGYTIARSVSAAMNVTFARSGYTYSGTLLNNTCISGQIESMNVWHKHLN